MLETIENCVVSNVFLLFLVAKNGIIYLNKSDQKG